MIVSFGPDNIKKSNYIKLMDGIMGVLRKFSLTVEAWIVGIGLFAFLGLLDLFAAIIF